MRRARPGLFRFRHVYFAVLALFLLGSAFTLHTRGGSWLELGSDFRPGPKMQVEMPAEGSIDALVDDWQSRHSGHKAELEGARQSYLLTLEGEPWEGSTSAEWIAGLAVDLGSRGAELKEMNSVDARLSAERILGSLSTLAPAVVVLAIGLEPLRGFAWAVLFGTVSGTLSSLFVVATFAAPKVKASVPSQGLVKVEGPPSASEASLPQARIS